MGHAELSQQRIWLSRPDVPTSSRHSDARLMDIVGKEVVQYKEENKAKQAPFLLYADLREMLTSN